MDETRGPRTDDAGVFVQNRMVPTEPTDRVSPNEVASTRFDLRLDPALTSESVEIDIPVIVEDELAEDDPTEVFQPGMHPDPRIRAELAASSGSSRRAVSPAAVRANPPARASYPAPPAPPSQPPIAPAVPPPNHPSLSEDWEGETMVKRPDTLPDADPVLANQPSTVTKTRQDPLDPVLQAARRKAMSDSGQSATKAFNPDETMKIDNSAEFELLDLIGTEKKGDRKR
jgi:cell wall-associated NlpC family hydrolase